MVFFLLLLMVLSVVTRFSTSHFNHLPICTVKEIDFLLKVRGRYGTDDIV